MACPDRPAIAYVGDGAWGMSMAEVMTCVRENIPAIAVVSIFTCFFFQKITQR